MGIKQPAAEGDVVAASAIGEKAVVANAMEAVRQGMQQETADALLALDIVEAILNGSNADDASGVDAALPCSYGRCDGGVPLDRPSTTRFTVGCS